MAQSVATGLVMPAVPTGQIRRPPITAGSPGYIPAQASTGLAQPGQSLGDATPALGDFPDTDGDEMLGSLEVGVVAIPHFPREAAQQFKAHFWEAKPRYRYTQQNAQYFQVFLPAPLGSDEVGLPEDDEANSVSASEAERFGGAAPGRAIPSEARQANQAHQANQVMSDTEVSETGATGVWSIAGRV